MAATGAKCPESMYYKNFSHTAAWPLTAIDHEMHMQMDTPSPWSVVEGFNFESLSYDWLHNVYLGIGRDLVASGILVLIEHNVFPLGADLDETLGNVHREVRRTCAKNGCLDSFLFHLGLMEFKQLKELQWGHNNIL